MIFEVSIHLAWRASSKIAIVTRLESGLSSICCVLHRSSQASQASTAGIAGSKELDRTLLLSGGAQGVAFNL